MCWEVVSLQQAWRLMLHLYASPRVGVLRARCGQTPHRLCRLSGVVPASRQRVRASEVGLPGALRGTGVCIRGRARRTGSRVGGAAGAVGLEVSTEAPSLVEVRELFLQLLRSVPIPAPAFTTHTCGSRRPVGAACGRRR
jgi:hypothetical protein